MRNSELQNYVFTKADEEKGQKEEYSREGEKRRHGLSFGVASVACTKSVLFILVNK